MEKEQTKNPVGKPPIIKNAEDLTNKINEYFKNPDYKTIVDKNGVETKVPIFTLCGLALKLGFESRQSIYDYEKNEKYSYIIKRARLFIENEYEKKLGDNNCTGIIFALKNMGWTDRTEIEQTNINKNPIPIEIIE